MATHGTILLTSKAEPGQILLQTPHDGHVQRALKILGVGRYKHPKRGLPSGWRGTKTGGFAQQSSYMFNTDSRH